ncbi:MAG: ATP-binding cassette domain-containing protein [Actinobacteria bacterium]|nr:ATP-binding cassette domain-containing protein [Actinomycetota bacterium]
MAANSVVELRGITVVRDGRHILDEVDLIVESGQHWVVLGPNGCGKSTLLRIAAFREHPTSGEVRVLDSVLGRVDIRRSRASIGWVAAGLTDALRPDLSAVDVVVTALHGALEPWWHHYTDDDRRRAASLLDRLGVAPLADRTFGSLSSGERQRVLLARGLMSNPAIVLLDEPAAGLDLGGREELMGSLEVMTSSSVPTVMVTHHADEIPAGATHALVMKAGRSIASGPIESTLTGENLSAAFGLAIELERRTDGRFSAYSSRRPD